MSRDARSRGGATDLRLRCADVHPVRCDAEWLGSDSMTLVDRAIAHGATAHGFTPAYYTTDRIAAIRRTAMLASEPS